MPRFVLGLIVTALWCATVGFAQNSSPWVGTWKLDTAQSKLQQAPKQETLQVVDGGSKDNIKWSIDGTAADGTTYHETFDGKADDGKSYPIMRDNKEFSQVTYRWINDNSVNALVKIPDGTVTTEKIDLAPDGKTMTLHLQSKSKDGKALGDEVAVYKKQ